MQLELTPEVRAAIEYLVEDIRQPKEKSEKWMKTSVASHLRNIQANKHLTQEQAEQLVLAWAAEPDGLKAEHRVTYTDFQGVKVTACRTSPRVYRHLVIGKLSYTKALVHARSNEARRNHRSAYQDDLASLKRYRNGTDWYYEQLRNGSAEDQDRLAGYLKGWEETEKLGLEGYINRRMDEQVAVIDRMHQAGEYNKTIEISWSQTRKKAEKMMAQALKWHDPVNIVPVSYRRLILPKAKNDTQESPK